ATPFGSGGPHKASVKGARDAVPTAESASPCPRRRVCPPRSSSTDNAHRRDGPLVELEGPILRDLCKPNVHLAQVGELEQVQQARVRDRRPYQVQFLKG